MGYRRILALLIAPLLACLVLASPAAAQALPDFTRPTLDGANLSLSDFRGRVVVLDFFATWCGPCAKSMPRLNGLLRRYQDKGLSVVAYSLDEGGRPVVKPWAARLGLEFPVVLGDTDEAKAKYAVRALPTTVIIDAQGREAARFMGVVSEARLERAVAPLLNGATAQAPAPAQARVAPKRLGNEGRVRQNWVTFDQIYQGHRGLFVHTLADVADLDVHRGLWLGLNLAPTLYGRPGTPPTGEPVRLYQRIDDPSREHFILFVRCDQMPPLPPGAAYRTWTEIIGPGQRVLDAGEPFWLSEACNAPAQAQPPANQPPLDQPAAWRGQDQAAQESQRIHRAWVDEAAEHNGRKGLMIHVEADLAELNPKDGLWMCINLWPHDAKGKVLTPHGRAITLFHRLQDIGNEHFILFVGCDQLPPLPQPDAGYRLWVTLLAGQERGNLARSQEFELGAPCASSTAP